MPWPRLRLARTAGAAAGGAVPSTACRGDPGTLACRLAGRVSGGRVAVLSHPPAGSQHRLHRTLLRTPRGAGAQPVADRAGQPQGKRLSGAGGGLAGAQRRRADRQYHRFRPVQSGGARVASVPSRRAGVAGDLLAGQPPALAGQPARPGAARPGHARGAAGAGRTHRHPADQFQGPGLAQRTQRERRGLLPRRRRAHGFRRRTGAALGRAGAQAKRGKTGGAGAGQLPDPRWPDRQRRRPGHPGGGAEHPSCPAPAGLPGRRTARQRNRADPPVARRRQQRPGASRPAALRPEPGAGRLPGLLRTPAGAQSPGGAGALGRTATGPDVPRRADDGRRPALWPDLRRHPAGARLSARSGSDLPRSRPGAAARLPGVLLRLRHAYRADALLHVGKHGNLEWLPGKGVGLSAECWPDALLGPLPNIYPFIVNDPGRAPRPSAAPRR